MSRPAVDSPQDHADPGARTAEGPRPDAVAGGGGEFSRPEMFSFASCGHGGGGVCDACLSAVFPRRVEWWSDAVSGVGFLAMQDQLLAVARTVEMLSDNAEMEALRAGLNDMRAGRIHTLDSIDEELKKK